MAHRSDNLGDLVQQAARELPPGFKIRLDVERECGFVLLLDRAGDSLGFPSNQETIEEAFADALEYARTNPYACDP